MNSWESESATSSRWPSTISLFPGAFTFNHSAELLGATLATSATISATLQLQIMQDFRSTVLATTAAFALHLAEDQFLAEIVRPATGEPVPAGHEEELVLTTLD